MAGHVSSTSVAALGLLLWLGGVLPQDVPLLTPAPEVEGLPQACDCTSSGLSGNADVGGRTGCGQHLLDLTGEETWYCYVDNPSGCPQAYTSEAFLGAAWRGCNPQLDVTTSAAENRTLWEIVYALPELSIFASAIETAGEVKVLTDTAPDAQFTVFAPTDDAFETMFEALGTNATDLLSSPRLLALLLRHIGIGAYSTDSLAGRKYTYIQTFSPAAFSSIRAELGVRITTSTGSIQGGTQVVLAEPAYDSSSPQSLSLGSTAYRELDASNGVLYPMSAVLALPLELVEAVGEVPQLATFSQALNMTGLGDLLSSDCPNATTADCLFNPITVWAPTDSAFQRLADSLGMALTDLPNLPQMQDVLLYHITDPTQVSTPILLSDLSDGDVLPTLYPDANITVVLNSTYVPVAVDPSLGPLFAQEQQLVLQGAGGGPVAGSARPATVEAYNGVVHAVDEVLLPYPLSAAAPAAEVVAPSAEGAAPPVAETTLF